MLVSLYSNIAVFIIARKFLVERLYLDVVVTKTNTHKCVKMYFKQIRPTCFGQPCGHHQEDALEMLDT